MDESLQIYDSRGFGFIKAASIHRKYVFQELLPANGINVILTM